MTTVFESKRDAWIVVLIWVGALVCLYAAFAQLGSGEPVVVRAVVLGFLLASAAFMLWLLYATDYTFADERLLIRCGPFRYRVPLSEIDSVRPSRNPLSSPACSLDRLLVTWRAGSRRILISPERKSEFLRELDRRCPQLELDGDALVGRSA